MSFKNTLDNIVATLQNDSDLQSFCMATWGKTAAVKGQCQKKLDVPSADLPLIEVTVPLDKPDAASGSLLTLNTVRLYCGFSRDNVEQAIGDAIQYKEYIRSALLKDRRRGNTAQATIPGPYQIDEEAIPPVYFLQMDFQIQK